MGANVTMVDTWGPGNSRSTSGDETRGIRTGYGTKEHWTRMASESIKRWRAWDAEWGRELNIGLYFDTGDLTMRNSVDPFIRDSMATWEQLGIEHELIDGDEVRYRYPQITAPDVNVGLYEVNAGICRARRSCEAVAEVFMRKGGKMVIAKADPGESVGGNLSGVTLANGESLSAGQYVFALGPWMRTFFPDHLGTRMRTPLAYVYYFGTPKGDQRFSVPNMPTWNIPATTGWPSLTNDARGFRVRTGGGDDDDPDTSIRWTTPDSQERARNILRDWFPGMVGQPILETRACHYESGIGRDFLVDHHPDYGNAWLAGMGNSEGFKQGPVIGEVIARRVLGAEEMYPDFAERFRMPTEEYGPRPTGGRGGRGGRGGGQDASPEESGQEAD